MQGNANSSSTKGASWHRVYREKETRYLSSLPNKVSGLKKDAVKNVKKDHISSSVFSYAETVKASANGSNFCDYKEECLHKVEETSIKEVVKWDEGANDNSWLRFYAVSVLKKISDVSSVIKGSRWLWNEFFSSVGTWSIAITPQSRLAWVEVRGIPMHVWCEGLCRRLGWAIGEPVLTADETLRKEKNFVGKVLVLIPFSHRCPGMIKVDTGKISFSVSVKEDSVPVSDEW
ncbi:hypothetical protein LWI29_014851 [Acer saccharum]|uniref:DUF4283 domain-containing protein n=1 Tax=Acer saccharum TaxID=4024 RepID=A0AA39RLF9_ACESA|nr:hypothetical protein LWI29_014851 [Acer saccharum]